MGELWKTLKRFLLRVCNFCKDPGRFVEGSKLRLGLLRKPYPDIRYLFGAEWCKTVSSQWHLVSRLRNPLWSNGGHFQGYSKLKFVSLSLIFLTFLDEPSL